MNNTFLKIFTLVFGYFFLKILYVYLKIEFLGQMIYNEKIQPLSGIGGYFSYFLSSTWNLLTYIPIPIIVTTVLIFYLDIKIFRFQSPIYIFIYYFFIPILAFSIITWLFFIIMWNVPLPVFILRILYPNFSL